MISHLPAQAIAVSGVAALILAGTFVIGGQLHPFRNLIHDRRSMISFAAGSSSAYVFVYLMPELNEVRHNFIESANLVLRFEGMAIYYVALIGFMVFYGLEHLRANLEVSDSVASGMDYKIHVGGFAAYVWLISYLLSNQLEEAPNTMLLYTIAMTFHFLTMDHALREEHGDGYQKKGRYLLAIMVFIGWGAGLVISLSGVTVALMTAFISGAIIMNSSLSELPSEKNGLFFPFLLGGVIYGLILIPLKTG